MANRILRDWTDSERINMLSPEAERMFTRLIMKADDFGYFHAHPSLLIAALFPLKIESVKSCDIEDWIRELEGNGLVFVYEVNYRKYLRINEFNQRLRTMVSKFPPPADNPPSIVRSPPLETKRSRNEVETELEDEGQDLLSQTGQESTTAQTSKTDSPKTKPLFNPTGTRIFSDWNELETTLIGEITWKESVCRKYKITMNRVETAVKSWIIHVSTQGQEYMALTEAKRWCANWIGSELKQMAKDQPNTPTYYKPHPLSSKK
jgi:hypothetical protein